VPDRKKGGEHGTNMSYPIKIIGRYGEKAISALPLNIGYKIRPLTRQNDWPVNTRPMSSSTDKMVPYVTVLTMIRTIHALNPTTRYVKQKKNNISTFLSCILFCFLEG